MCTEDGKLVSTSPTDVKLLNLGNGQEASGASVDTSHSMGLWLLNTDGIHACVRGTAGRQQGRGPRPAHVQAPPPAPPLDCSTKMIYTRKMLHTAPHYAPHLLYTR